jgi:hypothetical protein
VSDIRTNLGEQPDIAQGKEGYGMSRTLFQIANAVIKNNRQSRPDFELMDADIIGGEGDVTKLQSRTELVSRARAAEAALDAHKSALQSIADHEVKTNLVAVETSKLKIEKWKIALGICGIILGPGVVSFLINHVPNWLGLIVK